MLQVSRPTWTTTRTSGSFLSTFGRAPRRWRRASAMASFTFSATKPEWLKAESRTEASTAKVSSGLR